MSTDSDRTVPPDERDSGNPQRGGLGSQSQQGGSSAAERLGGPSEVERAFAGDHHDSDRSDKGGADAVGRHTSATGSDRSDAPAGSATGSDGATAAAAAADKSPASGGATTGGATTGGGTTGGGTTGGATTGEAKAGGSGVTLIPEDRAESFRARWKDIKGDFVDEPRAAVRGANELVGEVLDQLEELFRNQRAEIEKDLDNNDATTEDLRLALGRYRSFFDRLLSI